MDASDNGFDRYFDYYPDHQGGGIMFEYWAYLIPFLIVAPFARNKVLSLIYLMSYQYFVPDYWQLWITLYYVSMITSISVPDKS